MFSPCSPHVLTPSPLPPLTFSKASPYEGSTLPHVLYICSKPCRARESFTDRKSEAQFTFLKLISLSLVFL